MTPGTVMQHSAKALQMGFRQRKGWLIRVYTSQQDTGGTSELLVIGEDRHDREGMVWHPSLWTWSVNKSGVQCQQVLR